MNNILKLNSFMPSLERRALIKTTITLWNPGNIQLNDIEWRDEKWIAEDHVIGKVKELPLPESLKKKILGFIKPIGFEILKWIKQYQNFLCNYEIDKEGWSKKGLVDLNKVGKSLSKLCWTPQGTVDGKKTAEELIRDENLDITERYKLACAYCLRNDILKLWNKMPEYCRKSFYSEEDPIKIDDFNTCEEDLVVFWTYEIKGELTRMHHIFEREFHGCTPYVYAFEFAVVCNNKVATEYFWQNLTSEERENHLVRAAAYCTAGIGFRTPEEYLDVFVFLLSQMNEEQQLEELKENSYFLLFALLHWPWQDFFMETANRVWAFLSKYDYKILLEIIIDHKVRDGYKDYDYKKLFGEFWQRSPETHKKYVTDTCWDLLFYLAKVEDNIEYIKIICESASASDREKLLFSDGGKDFCERLIETDKMHSAVVFVRECISSKDVIMKFREELENHTICYLANIKRTREERTDKLNKLFQLLDELLLEEKRKSVDEGNTDSAAKRLCCHNK